MGKRKAAAARKRKAAAERNGKAARKAAAAQKRKAAGERKRKAYAARWRKAAARKRKAAAAAAAAAAKRRGRTAEKKRKASHSHAHAHAKPYTEYRVHEAGHVDGCEPGFEITTLAECKRALASLKLPTVTWKGKSTHMPRYCSVRTRKPRAAGHFNSAGTGHRRGDLYPVCKAVPKAKRIQISQKAHRNRKHR